MTGKIDYAKALASPATVFAGPEDVLAAAGLDRDEKIAILRQWEYDESEVAVAVEEGMPGNGSDLLQRIAATLVLLEPHRDESGPSKQRVPPSP